MASQEQERPHWSFDRRISVGHLFTTISVIATVILWAMSVETRFTELSIQTRSQVEGSAAMTAELKSLNEKVQILIEQNAYQRGISDAGKGRQP